MSSVSSSSDIFSAINGNAAAQASAATASAAATTTSQETQNRFLELLMTQLKNQDPLNPMDNAQVTTQLAQMSTVSGIEKLNTTLDTLLGAYNDAQSMQAAALIGKTVLVPGSGLALSNGSASGNANLSSAADQVTVNILDASGNVLQTENLGEQPAGPLDFTWDGKNSLGVIVPDGSYKFTVEAKQAGVAVSADALQLGTVNALVRGKSGFQLDLGNLGTVDFKSVQQIL